LLCDDVRVSFFVYVTTHFLWEKVR